LKVLWKKPEKKMANFVRFLSAGVFFSLRVSPMLEQGGMEAEGAAHG
jgi:hypothetical protein